MIRSTSREAYNTIKANGLLGKRQWEVYNLLFLHGPCTAMELRKFFPEGIVDSQIRARLNELRKFGVACEVRTRKCTVTGMNVIEWDVTDRLPIEPPKKKQTKCPSCDGSGYLQKEESHEISHQFSFDSL